MGLLDFIFGSSRSSVSIDEKRRDIFERTIRQLNDELEDIKEEIERFEGWIRDQEDFAEREQRKANESPLTWTRWKLNKKRGNPYGKAKTQEKGSFGKGCSGNRGLVRDYYLSSP